MHPVSTISPAEVGARGISELHIPIRWGGGETGHTATYSFGHTIRSGNIASMSKNSAFFLSALSLAPVISGQAQDHTAFEVASVKVIPEGARSGGPQVTGGPGTSDPTTWQYNNATLSGLVGVAYEKNYFEVLGPDWITRDRYQVIAKLPESTSKPQFQEMLRSLLAERLGLVARSEKRESTGYVLKLGATGTRMRRWTPIAVETSPSSEKIHVGADGYPVIPRGRGITMAIMNDRARFALGKQNMASFVQALSNQLAAPVRDETGLGTTDFFDIDLYWDPRTGPVPAEGLGPDLVHAVKEQLGLVLEQKKGLFEVIVVERANRTPTPN